MIINKKSYNQKNYLLGFILQLKWIILRISKKLSRRSIKVLRRPLENKLLYLAPVLKFDTHQNMICNSCMICKDICPTNAISINGNKEKKSTPSSFDINFKTCIFCMDCISYCPIDALEEGRVGLLSISGANDLTKSLTGLKK